MAETITVGCRLDPGFGDYQRLLEQGLAAEQHGFGSIWARDHVSLREHVGNDEHLECWTSMTALARDVPRVRIGPLVLDDGWRNPALVAKMAATLDIISGGRLIVAVGTGFLEREWVEYGYDFPPDGDRVRALAESMQIMKSMWTNYETTFEGRYHRTYKAVNEPKPIQPGGPPLLVGARGGPVSLKNIVRYADGWQSNLPADGFAKGRELIARFCEELGRDPATVESWIGFHAVFEPDPVKAKERVEAVIAKLPALAWLRERCSYGGPQQMLDYLAPLAKGGCRNFIAYFMEPERHIDNISGYGDEVIPLLGQLI